MLCVVCCLLFAVGDCCLFYNVVVGLLFAAVNGLLVGVVCLVFNEHCYVFVGCTIFSGSCSLFVVCCC